MFFKRSLLVILSFCSLVFANVNIYPFENPLNEKRFKSLITELRCPKCQNQNIADSDADLAKDLKDIIYVMVKDGQSDQEIVRFMVDRYGDFVLYNPPVKPLTWFLWFGPFAILCIVLLGVFLRKPKVSQTAPLSDEEKKLLNEQLSHIKE